MKNKVLKNIVICIISAIVYFIAAYPLRDIFAVFTVTDVRPGAVVNPFLSICFGPAASIGCMISNCFADYLSGYPTKVLYQGLIPQFLYGYIPYLMWKKFTKGDEHSHRLDNTKKILQFTLISLVYGIISGICVGYIVQSNFGANFLNTLIFVFLNNFDMTMILGCPLMIASNIIISAHRNNKIRSLSLNEIIILFTNVVELVGMIIIGFAVYKTNANVDSSVYNVWNTIYTYSTLYINIMMVASFILMLIIERRGFDNEIR